VQFGIFHVKQINVILVCTDQKYWCETYMLVATPNNQHVQTSCHSGMCFGDSNGKVFTVFGRHTLA